MSSTLSGTDHVQARFWICVGLIAGLLVSVPVGWRWLDQGSGTRISVLGTGRQVSVLITHDRRRVLIAAGSDGAAFSNAISKALPPIGGEIDLLMIDSRASADVADRARGLDANETMRLPDSDEPVDAKTVQRSFLVDMGEGLLIKFRVEPGSRWSAVIESRAGTIVITPGPPLRGRSEISISLDGSELSAADNSTGIGIGPNAGALSRTSRIATVSPGGVLVIEFEDDQLRVSRDFFDFSPSSERSNHVARFDRQLLLEL